ncbi:hypothetical protein FACS189454_01600 [Planctomycetales bacterium]|nr:hypothetical protein FACS189454_01600 [Planctomycetales bacterium]
MIEYETNGSLCRKIAQILSKRNLLKSVSAISIIAVAILIFFIGHFVKVLRWELFVQIYEKPVRHRLLTSLSIGYLVNHIVPMRLGELVRAALASTKSKIGFPFMLATVIVDRFLDILVVGGIFVILPLVKIEKMGGGQIVKVRCSFILPLSALV